MRNEKLLLKAGKFLLTGVIALLLLPAPSSAKEWHEFDVKSVVYNPGGNPSLSYKKFKSKIVSYSESGVKVYEIKNFIKSKKKHDSHIKIAISSSSAGSVVYNGNGEVIVEYGNGFILSENLLSFKIISEQGKVRADWYISDDLLMSDYSIRAKDDTVLYKETVVYTLKGKKYKKRKSRARRGR